MRGKHTLYEGPVRGLCALAPNNVNTNTMAAAALAAVLSVMQFPGAFSSMQGIGLGKSAP